MNLDNSMISTYKDCPRRFFHEYVENLRPKNDSNRFKAEYGNAWHKALEIWYREMDKEKMLQAFIDYWMPFEGQDLTGVRCLSKAIVHLEEYCKRYTNEPFDILSEYIECGGLIDLMPGISYMFKPDMIINWQGGGIEGYFLLDHKTTARKGFVQTRPNSQFPGYVYALTEITGLKIKGVVMNTIVFRKGKKGEPIENCVEFSRELTEYSQWEIDKWKSDVIYWIQRIIDTPEGVENWVFNTNSCLKYGRCPFMNLCYEPDSSPLKEIIKIEAYEKFIWEPFKGARKLTDEKTKIEGV